ncbi:MAG: hypothetical protein ACRDJM_05650 [Actinomycetota bacterium]
MGLRTNLASIRFRAALAAAAVLIASFGAPVVSAGVSPCHAANSFSDTSFPLFVKLTCSFDWTQDLDQQMSLAVQGTAAASSLLIRLRVDVLDARGDVLLVCETPAGPGWDTSPSVCFRRNSHFFAPDGTTLTCRVIAEAPSGFGVIFLHGQYGCPSG